jgi:hypothetical protein
LHDSDAPDCENDNSLLNGHQVRVQIEKLAEVTRLHGA